MYNIYIYLLNNKYYYFVLRIQKENPLKTLLPINHLTNNPEQLNQMQLITTVNLTHPDNKY